MRIFRMIIECLTPLHCGGGEQDPLQDQPVSRDAFGLWRIPGSSLAGSLRSLSSRLNPELTAKMFGERDAGGPRPSLVWAQDAILLDFDGQAAMAKKLAGKPVALPLGPFVRDHVALDLDRGSALKGGKFDAEIVPAGARFLVSLRCDGWNRELEPTEEAHFDRLCALLQAGVLEMGGKTANGYGRYRSVQAQYRNLNLDHPSDMQTWLNLTRAAMLKPGEGHEVPLPQVTEALPGPGLNGWLNLDLVCNTPILIAGGDPGLAAASEADLVFALTPWLDYGEKRLEWRPVLPGTSLKGVLRHAVYKILRDKGWAEADAAKRLGAIFGRIEGDGAGQCGKLVVEDCPLNRQARPQFIQHVALDRFTGGARDGALFSEEPYWLPGLDIPLRIHAQNMDAADAGLVFQALLDLGQGLLSVGSGGNRGNGRLQAKAGLTPQAFLDSLAGNLAWNSSPILQGDSGERLKNFLALASEWDAAMEAEA